MAIATASLLISRGRLRAGALAGEVVVVTGAGGGIGLEAARALRWLGADVVIAEVDVAARAHAETELPGVLFVATDVADERSVDAMVAAAKARFGKIDVVVNNATYAPFGLSVAEAPIAAWDRSYAVNLRGPALLARECLPEMVARRHGVFVCVSSTGGPFLAPYETLKAAQVALGNALDAELDGTGVVAFTIGPGLVPTKTASEAIERLAPRLGMTVEQFWAANSGAVLSVEAAGAGFAAAVAQAERYAGQEISSAQALIDAGIELDAPAPAVAAADAAGLARVRATLAAQLEGWKSRSFFERQWMLREFKQRAGVPVERMLEDLQRGTVKRSSLEKLSAFYGHMGELAAGYVKEPAEREEQARIVAGWKSEVDSVIRTR